MSDKDIAIRLCELLNEDPNQLVPDPSNNSTVYVRCERWASYLPEIRRTRAVIQALGESMLEKLDLLMEKS